MPSLDVGTVNPVRSPYGYKTMTRANDGSVSEDFGNKRGRFLTASNRNCMHCCENTHMRVSSYRSSKMCTEITRKLQCGLKTIHQACSTHPCHEAEDPLLLRGAHERTHAGARRVLSPPHGISDGDAGRSIYDGRHDFVVDFRLHQEPGGRAAETS